MVKNNYYFYVLECADGSFYGGYAADVQKRLAVHNSGKGAKYTRNRLPVKLIYYERYGTYYERYGTKSEAMRAEYKFKKLTRKEKEKFLREFWSREHTKELSKQ